VRVRQLEAFVAVAETLHFGHAAERLHLSQSALSRQIDQLERELGVPLLLRDRRHVELTDAGAAYLEGLRAAMAQLTVAGRTARQVGSGELARLRIGHVDSSSYDVLPDALRRFRRAHHGVAISMVETGSLAIAERLRNGRMDVGLVRSDAGTEEVEDLLLLEEPFVAALPHDHPAAGEATVDPAALSDDHFVIVLRRSAPVVHDHVMAICGAAGFVPANVYEAAPLASALPLVAAGLATALVPRGLANHMAVPGVVYRPLTGTRPVLELRAAWRRADPSPLVATFVAALRDVAGRLYPQG
jgi:DNA-binding transcriptional LysR family regulator